MRLEAAKKWGDYLIGCFYREVEKIEIAGSVRRENDPVKDLELVLIPRIYQLKDLFGRVVETQDLFMNKLFTLQKSGIRGSEMKILKNGPKYKQIEISDFGKVDLFIVTPPAEFGCIFALRTGPKEFNKWLVTSKLKGGALPPDLTQDRGALWRGSEKIITPTEADYFTALGLALVHPAQRVARWGK